MSPEMNITESHLGHFKYQLTGTPSSSFILRPALVLHGECWTIGARIVAVRPQIGAQLTKIEGY